VFQEPGCGLELIQGFIRVSGCCSACSLMALGICVCFWGFYLPYLLSECLLLNYC
jgi:hypothetical protein